MRKFFLVIVLCLSSLFSKAQYSEVAFYVVAHQDDWQLFMGADAYKYTSNKNFKAVFIYTTSGNAGLVGDKGYGEGFENCGHCKMPYFRSREIGAIASLQFIHPPSNSWQWCHCWPYPEMKEVSVMINDKLWYIKKYSYCNTESYFLRISNDDLEKLSKGNSITTVKENAKDHQNTFRNWTELTSLLAAIITYEQASLFSFTLNTNDLSESINPNDHIEHRYTSKACTEAVVGMNVKINYYLGYHSEQFPDNLSADEIAIESALMACYNKAVIDAGWWDDWKLSTKLFKRSYKREVIDSIAIKSPKLVQQKVEMVVVAAEQEKKIPEQKKNTKGNLFTYLILLSIIILWVKILIPHFKLPSKT